MANIDRFMHAIRTKESGGNYGAYNASSGASGAYQFTYGTWKYALQLAGLGGSKWAMSGARYAPHSVQDAAARALMLHYYNQFGHSWYNVAEAWYGGPGAVGHPNWGGGPGYPTVGQYASSVMALYRSYGGTGGGAGGGAPAVTYQYINPEIVRKFERANHFHNHAIPHNINWIRYNAEIRKGDR